MKPSSPGHESLIETLMSYVTLFGSMGTLICCALPALLVSLGLGAVLAGLATNVPGLVWVSEHKALVFLFAGFMLAGNGFLLWKNRTLACPIDPKLRDACAKGRSFSIKLYFTSLMIYCTGAFFAFVAPVLYS